MRTVLLVAIIPTLGFNNDKLLDVIADPEPKKMSVRKKVSFSNLIFIIFLVSVIINFK